MNDGRVEHVNNQVSMVRQMNMLRAQEAPF